MAKTKKLRISMTTGETALGWLYLLLELFIIPILLVRGNALLPSPLSTGWVNFLYFLLNFIAVIWIFHGFLGKSLAAVGKKFGDFLKAVVLGFVALWACNTVLDWLIGLVMPDFVNINDSSIAQMASLDFWVVTIGTVLLVPTAEEVLYRGLLFQGLYTSSPLAAYIVSILVFCAIHVVGFIGSYDVLTLVVCFLQYIPAGLCLAWAYAEADTIFAPILIHTVVNALSIYTLR